MEEALYEHIHRTRQRYNHKRSEDEVYYERHLEYKRPRFDIFPKNKDLDFDTKRVALQLSSFVVSLQSYTSGEELSQGCGAIMEVDGSNTFVLTSASLVRRPTKKHVARNTLAHDLTVMVHTSNGTSYKGEIVTWDFHYNLLVIAFESSSSIEALKLKSIDLHESVFEEEKPFQLRPHSVKVKPNESVIVVGRYFYKPFLYMAAPGCFFRVKDYPSYECKELLQASCRITRCGDGGPVINRFGEVIGIAFYNICGCPVLPINIPCKWWDHYKSYKEHRHPSYGFEASNLEYSADVEILERVKREFPSISHGVVVEKVLPGSNAQKSGLSVGDMIVKCGGKTVKSFLQLWELMFDKVGKSVKLKVARLGFDEGTIVKLRMVVTEATPDELNNWPLYERDLTPIELVNSLIFDYFGRVLLPPSQK